MTTSTTTIAQNSAMNSWSATVSGGATPILTVGGSNNSQVTLPVAGDYFVQFHMTKRSNNSGAVLQVFTGANCLGTAHIILGEASTSGAAVSASGIIRTISSNTALQICQKGNQSITPSPAIAGSATGSLTVMRLN